VPRPSGWRFAGIFIALGLAVAACTPASDQPTAEQALCDALATFGESVQAIADTDPATDSVEDIQAAADTAQTAWDGVGEAVAAVDEADDAAVDAAWSDLADQIGNFATDVPVADAVDQISGGVDEVQNAYNEMRDGLGCDGAPAAS
jgi:hypothetical protein